MFWLMTLSVLVAGVICDLRRREISDAIPLALLALAAASCILHLSPGGWPSLALGSCLGAAIGLLLFWSGGFGGADAKILAALGAIVGPRDFLLLFVYVALSGGVLALVAGARGKRDLPYGPALALGFIAFLVARGLR